MAMSEKEIAINQRECHHLGVADVLAAKMKNPQLQSLGFELLCSWREMM